jgi:hypothetical protein
MILGFSDLWIDELGVQGHKVQQDGDQEVSAIKYTEEPHNRINPLLKNKKVFVFLIPRDYLQLKQASC